MAFDSMVGSVPLRSSNAGRMFEMAIWCTTTSLGKRSGCAAYQGPLPFTAVAYNKHLLICGGGSYQMEEKSPQSETMLTCGCSMLG